MPKGKKKTIKSLELEYKIHERKWLFEIIKTYTKTKNRLHNKKAHISELLCFKKKP